MYQLHDSIVQALSKLTNLTSLTFPGCIDFDILPEALEPGAMKMPALRSLKFR